MPTRIFALMDALLISLGSDDVDFQRMWGDLWTKLWLRYLHVDFCFTSASMVSFQCLTTASATVFSTGGKSSWQLGYPSTMVSHTFGGYPVF